MESSYGPAPVPRISSPVPRYADPPAWYPPARRSDGDEIFYTAHTDALATIADTIRAGVPGLRQGITLLRSYTQTDILRAIPGEQSGAWPAGSQFTSTALSAQTALADAAGQIAGLHLDAVRRLAATASAYARAEDANYREFIAAQKSGQGWATFGELPVPDNPRAEASPVARTVPIKEGYGYPMETSPGEGIPWPQIMDILHGIVPAVFGELGAAMLSVAGALDEITGDIETGVAALARQWDGSSAQKAFQAFGVLHGQTATLAAEAAHLGNVMLWVGSDVLPPFRNLPDPILDFAMLKDLHQTTVNFEMTGSPAQQQDEMAAQQAAQGYLQALSGYLAEAYNAIPPAIAGQGAWTPQRGT